MSNKYPPTYILRSAYDVAVVRTALINYQDSLRSDVKSLVDRDCFQLAIDKLNDMFRIEDLIKDIDSYIEFDDSDDVDFSELDSVEASADMEVL